MNLKNVTTDELAGWVVTVIAWHAIVLAPSIVLGWKTEWWAGVVLFGFLATIFRVGKR